MGSNIVNSNDENVVAIKPKISIFSFLKIVEIEFKMKLQSFFLFRLSKCLHIMIFHIFHIAY